MRRQPSKKRRILPPSERQEMILDAAAEMFSRYGYESCEVDKIAAHAGIGKGTIYRHFESKEALFLSAIDRGYAQLDEKMRELECFVAETGDMRLAAEDFITKELTLYVDFFIDNPEYYRLLMVERPEIRLRLHEETIKGHYTHIARRVERTRRAIEKGKVIDLNPSFMVYCLMAVAGVIVERRLYGTKNTVRKDIRNAAKLLTGGSLSR